MNFSFQKTLVIFGILFGVFVFGTLFGLFLAGIGYIPVAKENKSQIDAEQKEIIVDLAIDYGNGDIQSFPNETFQAGNTVFGLLQTLERKHGILIETRNFPGLGVFIEAIHGVHNTNNSYWQFWVNGEYAQVGAGQYKLEEGDEVLWRRTSEKPD